MKKGIIYSFIISLVICMIMPFTVNAAALSVYFNTDELRTEWNGKILGDYWQYTTTDNATDNDLYIYKFRFDKAYIGQIQFQVRFSGQSSWASGSERVLVAGYESFDWYYREYTIDSQNTRINAVNITSVNLTPLDDFGGDLASIISYLQSIDATEDDIYSVLQSISSDVETLTKIKQWHFPIESIGIVFPTFEYGFNQIGMISYNDYDFPIFNIPNNSMIFRTYGTQDHKYHWIFIADKNYYSLSLLQQNFTIQNGSITKFGYINRFYYNYDIRYIFNIEVTSSSNSFLSITYNGGSDMLYMPIYFNDFLFNNISTDFALRFGLSNQLLDDIHVIAQGTQQSQSAAGDLEQGTSDLASDISSYNQIESDYNNQMNQALNNIDFSDQFSNNQNFLSGASFVKTVFNSFMQIDILRIFFIVLCIVLIAKRFI